MVCRNTEGMTPLRGRAEFIARGPELARLNEALAEAASGSPALVTIGADAGVGKTRLLQEFTAAVDAAVLWGACLPMGDRGLPLAPVAEALRNLPAEAVPAGQFPPVVAPLLAPGGVGSEIGTVSASQVFRGVLELIEAIAADAPVVMVVEDLHWADQWTRDLLTFLVANLRTQRLLLIGSYRTDELSTDDLLRRVLVEVARYPHYQRIDVAPFTIQQVADQIEALTGDRPPANVVDLVFARTEGNAYFVEELVKAGCLDGRELPASLTDLLLVRASVVSPPARQLLRVASLAVGDADDAVLAEVSGSRVEEVRSVLHELIDAHLLSSTPHGVTFRHALLKEVIQQEPLAGERREYHAAYAAALNARATPSGRRATVTAQLAYHLQEAGNIAEAMSAWVAAASEAEAVGAFAEAHHYLANALASWTSVDDPQARTGSSRVELLSRTAYDAQHVGESTQAVAFVRQALDLVDESADPVRASVLYADLSNYLTATREADEAGDAMTRAVKLASGTPPSKDHAHVLAAHAGYLVYQGRLREARAVSRQAVTVARHSGATDIESRALHLLGFTTCFLDDVSEGIAQLRAGVALARQAGHPLYQAMAMWNLYVAAVEAARWDDAVDAARSAIVELPRLGSGHKVPEMYAYLQQDLARLGRFDEARTVMEEAFARFPFQRDDVVSPELLIALGDFERVRRVLAQSEIRRDTEAKIWSAGWSCALETWQGNTEQARTALDTAVELSSDTDRLQARAYALLYGLRCEADAADRCRTRRDSDELSIAVERGQRLHALLAGLLDRPGPAEGWKREVGVVAGVGAAERTRLIGSPDPDAWRAAVDVAHDLALGYLEAYGELRLAEAIVRSGGDRDDAARRVRHVHQLATGWGTRPLRELVEQLAARARLDLGAGLPALPVRGLTPREYQVLELITRGASNRQISDELFISEKTTSVHVSNILRKLGVASRGEAASMAYEKGWVRL